MNKFNSTTLFPPDFFKSNQTKPTKPNIRYLEPLPEENQVQYKIIVTSPRIRSLEPINNLKMTSSVSSKNLKRSVNSIDPFLNPLKQLIRKDSKLKLPHLKPLVHNSIFSPRLSNKYKENAQKDNSKHMTVTFSQKSFKILNEVNNC